MSPTITITANGQEFQTRDCTPIPDYLREHKIDPQQVVVEWNGKALTRDEAALVRLSDGDRLEIVRIVAGG